MIRCSQALWWLTEDSLSGMLINEPKDTLKISRVIQKKLIIRINTNYSILCIHLTLLILCVLLFLLLFYLELSDCLCFL